jgi:hypothetical protein
LTHHRAPVLGLALTLFVSAAPALEAGRAAYENGQYEQCVSLLGAAATRDEHVYVGLCHFALGQPGDAARHFTRALELDPAAALPPFSPPKAVAFFSTLKTQQARVELSTAVQAFERGELDEATRQLTLVRKRPLPPGEEVQARLLEGALAHAWNQPDAADLSFRAALALDDRAVFSFLVAEGARARLEALRRPAEPALASARWPRVAVTAGAGLAFLAGGGVLLGLAHGGASALRAGDATIRTPDDLVRRNETIRVEQTVGFVLGGVGLAALGVATALWFTGEDSRVALVTDGSRWQLVWAARW